MLTQGYSAETGLQLQAGEPVALAPLLRPVVGCAASASRLGQAAPTRRTLPVLKRKQKAVQLRCGVHDLFGKLL